MAQEYILIKEKQEDTGLIALSKGVFETISLISVDEMKEAQQAEATALRKPILCKIQNNKLNVTVDIKVKYGSNVNKVCEDLQSKIYQTILQMTNLKCNLIDVKVTGFVF